MDDPISDGAPSGKEASLTPTDLHIYPVHLLHGNRPFVIHTSIV